MVVGAENNKNDGHYGMAAWCITPFNSISNLVGRKAEPDLEMGGELAGRWSVRLFQDGKWSFQRCLSLAIGISAMTTAAFGLARIVGNFSTYNTSSTPPLTDSPSTNPTWNGTVCPYTPPNGTNSTLLQDRINALNWQVNVSAECAYPFMQEHPDRCDLNFDGFIPPGVEHVPPRTFVAQLQISVDQFNQWLSRRNSKDYVVVLNGISDQRVFEQALPYLERLPKDVLRYDLGTAGNQVRNLAAFHKEHPEVKTFATFDFISPMYPDGDCMIDKRTVCALSELDQRDECLGDQNWPTSKAPHCDDEYFNAKRSYDVAYILPSIPNPTCMMPNSATPFIERCTQAQDHIWVFSSQFNGCDGVTVVGASK